MPLINRRSTVALGASFATSALRGARADTKTFRIALNLPFTGGEAEGAIEIKDGVMLAVDEISAKGGVAGYKLEIVLMDDGTATAGDDPRSAWSVQQRLGQRRCHRYSVRPTCRSSRRH